MSDIEDEFASDAKEEAATTDLSEVTKLAMDQLRLEGEVAAIEADLNLKKQELTRISQGKLPAAMRAAKMAEFKLENGMTVSVKSDMKVSVPKARKPDVIAKMKEWGYVANVTNTVTVDLGKGNDNAVKSLTAIAEEMGLKVAVAEDIATGTVKSALKKRQDAGKNDDLAWFGAFEFTEASVK